MKEFRWRWSKDIPDHFEIQCPHMAERWAGFDDVDTDEWPFAVLPLGPDGWTIVQREPLTVIPSILLGDCGCHGFIIDGQWVSC